MANLMGIIEDSNKGISHPTIPKAVKVSADVGTHSARVDGSDEGLVTTVDKMAMEKKHDKLGREKRDTNRHLVQIGVGVVVISFLLAMMG